MGDPYLKTLVLLLGVSLLIGCGSVSDIPAPAMPAAADDLHWIDTLHDLDEKSEGILEAASSQSTRKELSAFADDASHAYKERSDEIEDWRALWFPTATQNVVLPACAQSELRVAANASDAEILDALVTHRQCALSYTNEALDNVRSTGARHVLEGTFRTFTAELQELRAWRTAWQ